MKQYYLGLRYMNKQGALNGSLSWEDSREDFPFSSLQDAEKEICTLYNMDYRTYINSAELETELPIYSIEDKDGNMLVCYTPPIILCNFLSFDYRRVMEKLGSLKTMVVTLPESKFGELPMFRYCFHCGKTMREGYYIDGDYACSEKCAISLYKDDEMQFKEDLQADEEHNYGVVYYTEWEDFNLANS